MPHGAGLNTATTHPSFTCAGTSAAFRGEGFITIVSVCLRSALYPGARNAARGCRMRGPARRLERLFNRPEEGRQER